MIVLGSTGMLGRAIIDKAIKSNLNVIGIARSSADINLDVLDFKRLRSIIKIKKPKIILNCIAITDINFCEADINKAYLINSHLVSVLVDICREFGIYLIHVSTDHFYTNDANKKHNEKTPVVLLNNYAKTKFMGECFALTYPKALVVRTNIVGFRYKKQDTFVEWVLSSLSRREKITLFQDFYTSSIDVYNFSDILFKIINRSVGPIYGLINIASSEVCNKETFVKKLGSMFGYMNNNFKLGSVASLDGAKRAESLGLDISKIEKLLNIKMPTINQVICSLYDNRK
jgi:dTDP-4-dehydrorhamnose reductase